MSLRNFALLEAKHFKQKPLTSVTESELEPEPLGAAIFRAAPEPVSGADFFGRSEPRAVAGSTY